MMEDNKETCTQECENAEATQDVAQTESPDAQTETDNAQKAAKDKKRSKKADAEVEGLKLQLEQEQEKYMRLYAEYENFRKRSAKEREGIYTDACCDAIAQILPILDNLERAAQFADGETDSQMAKGLELTLKSFIETMNKMGVYEIEALGKNFDPNLHNAVMHVEDENEEENKVVEVFMKGYAKGDKVLRYSMVKVAN